MPALTYLSEHLLKIKLREAVETGFGELRFCDFKLVDTNSSEIRKLLDKVSMSSDTANPIVLDFAFSNLSGCNFSNLNLTSCIFTGIEAKGTQFTKSDLSDVDFSGSNLSGADFRMSVLRFAKLYLANIEGANFMGADLTDAFGLLLRHPTDATVERLGKASSIRGAILPRSAEKLREAIEQAISVTA